MTKWLPASVALVLALGAARARAADDGPVPDLVKALVALPDGDLVRFAPHRLGAPVELELLARVRAPAARVLEVLADPAAYRRAVPSFIRAETLRTAPTGPGLPPARLLAWELEIPLWNLAGRLWLRPRVDGASLEIAAGDLAPGRFHLTVLPRAGESLLVMRGGANLKNANWITRRLAARHQHAEPAMAVAAAYVLLRGLALEAERGGGAVRPARWPRAAPGAPAAAALDGRVLAGSVAAVAPLPRGAALARVRSRADGRLEEVSVAFAARTPADRLQAALGQASHWRALPGWGDIEVRPAGRGAPGTFVWEVDSTLPFVDFDAEWGGTARPRFRAVGQGGDWRGAVMGWDLVPTAPGASAGPVAVFSTHPRIDNTGYLPRRLIQAEPLLEHGLALGLAYVNAISLLHAIEAGP